MSKQQELESLLSQALSLAKELDKDIDNLQEALSAVKENNLPPSVEIFGIIKDVVKGDGYNFWDNGWYRVRQSCFGAWETESEYDDADSPVFTTEKSADNWANVFSVIMELRCCDGITKDAGYFVRLDALGEKLAIDWAESEEGSYEVGNISPYYESEDFAREAIDKVGEERIINAIKTIAGIKES